MFRRYLVERNIPGVTFSAILTINSTATVRHTEEVSSIGCFLFLVGHPQGANLLPVGMRACNNNNNSGNGL